MCLAIPAKVVTIDTDTAMARVALGEINKEISIALLEDVQVGDYVLVHVGYALNKLDREQAERTLRLFAEAGIAPDPAPDPAPNLAP